LVIENIPLIDCPHCGTSYFKAKTLYDIERIKADRKALAIVRDVPVAEFS
jgi:hypothetical protein